MEKVHKYCVEMCLAGIEVREVTKGKGTEKIEMERGDCDKVTKTESAGKICTAYLDPALKWRLGHCPLVSNQIKEDEVKKKTQGQRKQKSFR